MLMHVINGTSKAAPGCSNSSHFEAFLTIVSRVGKLVSGRKAPLRDIVQQYVERLAYCILRARGGETAAALSRAAIPARQRINAWCSDGLAAPAEGGPGMIPERVFVVVRRFRDQAGADEKAIWGLCTTPRASHESAPLRRLSTIDDVLRAVRVFPARWPGMTG